MNDTSTFIDDFEKHIDGTSGPDAQRDEPPLTAHDAEQVDKSLMRESVVDRDQHRATTGDCW